MSGYLNQTESAKDWGDSMKRAKADIAAGRIVAVGPVMERLRASAELMEARRAEATRKV